MPCNDVYREVYIKLCETVGKLWSNPPYSFLNFRAITEGSGTEGKCWLRSIVNLPLPYHRSSVNSAWKTHTFLWQTFWLSMPRLCSFYFPLCTTLSCHGIECRDALPWMYNIYFQDWVYRSLVVTSKMEAWLLWTEFFMVFFIPWATAITAVCGLGLQVDFENVEQSLPLSEVDNTANGRPAFCFLMWNLVWRHDPSR